MRRGKLCEGDARRLVHVEGLTKHPGVVSQCLFSSLLPQPSGGSPRACRRAAEVASLWCGLEDDRGNAEEARQEHDSALGSFDLPTTTSPTGLPPQRCKAPSPTLLPARTFLQRPHCQRRRHVRRRTANVQTTRSRPRPVQWCPNSSHTPIPPPWTPPFLHSDTP